MSQYPAIFSIWLQSISNKSFRYIKYIHALMMYSVNVNGSSGVLLTLVIITIHPFSTTMGFF